MPSNHHSPTQTSLEVLTGRGACSVLGTVERVKKIRDYAFVHFTQREHAINAMNTLNGKVGLLAVVCDTSCSRMLHFSANRVFLCAVHPGSGWLPYRGDSGQAGGQGQLRPIHQRDGWTGRISAAERLPCLHFGTGIPPGAKHQSNEDPQEKCKVLTVATADGSRADNA